MKDKKKCSSYIPENGVYGSCKDGHFQTAVCAGIDGLPTCCNEELCGRLYDHNGGKPLQGFTSAVKLSSVIRT